MTKTLALATPALAVALGCNDKPPIPWGPKRATELVVGPYHLPIPAGWRDLAECQDKRAALPPETHGMTPESPEAGAMRSHMVFQWTKGGPLPDCHALADALTRPQHGTASNVEAFEQDGERGCRWRYGRADGTGIQLVRTDGDHLLTAAWSRLHVEGAVDLPFDAAVWKHNLAVLHLPDDGFQPSSGGR